MIDYDSASATYDNTRRPDDRTIELMATRCSFAKGSRVLDFGCGTGSYLARLSELYDCELFGLEPSEEMRQKAIAKNPGIRVERGDHALIPFPDSFFDLIYMTDVVHHVPDLGLLFANIAAKLAQDGLVCIVTESWGQIDARWYNAYFPSLAGNEKLRYPELPRLVMSAREAGLQCLSVDEKANEGPHSLDADFLRMVGEKNYSMFRLLDPPEYEAGYAAMRRDEGRCFFSPGAGECFMWLHK
jgi:SAM-dependent methyltransferase